jgi:hypothetical protein
MAKQMKSGGSVSSVATGKPVKAQGPDKSSGAGKGGRSNIDLTPEMQRMRGSAEKLPADAMKVASGTEPVPAIDAKPINTKDTWDQKRDRAFEKASHR